MKELPTLQESSDAVKLGAGLELCHHTAEDCRQMEHSLPSCVMEAVKIEPRDEQQSNCDSGLPAGFLEVEKEEPFFMEEDSATVADFKPFQIPFLGLDSLKAEPVKNSLKCQEAENVLLSVLPLSNAASFLKNPVKLAKCIGESAYGKFPNMKVRTNTRRNLMTTEFANISAADL
ncbi:uncharacterized protein LOC108673962 [Hyalella azteca]|uniref:Uncharacterized protein LOC108673962 n=1 Tax=Hyalella azteca TaxID=294128 RepID=A0A8B7NUD1_HYAAZ|nr:uncharacterized protein LOC108673962 [Hyalella azteca]